MSFNNADNPYKKYEYLLEGWPGGFAWQVQGEHGMCISCGHATPDRLKMAHTYTFMFMVGLGALLGYFFYLAYSDPTYNMQDGTDFLAKLLVGFWLLMSFIARWGFIRNAKKATNVLISPNYIEIGAQVYDARVQHRFTMELHHRAREEERAEEYAERQAEKRGSRVLWRPFRYYRDSYHIFLEYLGQHILVTDIHGEENAGNLLRGLMAMDKIVHRQKTVFATNANTIASTRAGIDDYTSDREESPGARAERLGYHGKRPTLD